MGAHVSTGLDRLTERSHRVLLIRNQRRAIGKRNEDEHLDEESRVNHCRDAGPLYTFYFNTIERRPSLTALNAYSEELDGGNRRAKIAVQTCCDNNHGLAATYDLGIDDRRRLYANGPAFRHCHERR